MSVNKNIPLAVKSFKQFTLSLSKNKRQDHLLVVAGGYDDAVVENVEHYEELTALSEGIDNIKFLRSISNEQRLTLLEHSDILLYTPENEHFGIVPVEAMYMGCIVLACNSGGPTESILDTKTGFLLPPNDIEKWSDQIKEILNYKHDSEKLVKIKQQSKQRVIDTFSFEQFSSKLVEFVLG